METHFEQCLLCLLTKANSSLCIRKFDQVGQCEVETSVSSQASELVSAGTPLTDLKMLKIYM